MRGSRVLLESLAWLWREGHNAEAIQNAYSTLTLADVYGAITYSLDHRDEVDKQLATSEATDNGQRSAAEAADPCMLRITHYARLREQLTI